MNKSKKQDQIVFNEEKQQYDAFLKDYITDISGPKIELPDVVSWKSNNIYTANKYFISGFEDIKKSYDTLMEVYQYNAMIYEAKYSFEPIVGNVYHVYKKSDGTVFLSILQPNECNFNYVGSFRLNSDKVWKKIERR
ncbi:DUF2452 domain-containing protein [Pseudofulvibacter geojedonensis]|uniref:DUF2452 domain-containing protein n=1 Tax=Pseudofulvibacter geojedonensis TaxID=1123758 RepID=A0ABW3I2Y7_9FLAO